MAKSWETELHLPPEGSDPVLYQCPTCSGVAETRRRNPSCFGTHAAPHPAVTMRRVDEWAVDGATPGLVIGR
jgi:hypothetical protein